MKFTKYFGLHFLQAFHHAFSEFWDNRIDASGSERVCAGRTLRDAIRRADAWRARSEAAAAAAMAQLAAGAPTVYLVGGAALPTSEHEEAAQAAGRPALYLDWLGAYDRREGVDGNASEGRAAYAKRGGGGPGYTHGAASQCRILAPEPSTRNGAASWPVS